MSAPPCPCPCSSGDPHKLRQHVTRCFHRYTSADRADLQSSRRLGHRQREAVGEHYYVSDLTPGLGYRTRGLAERATLDAIEADAPPASRSVAL